MSETATECPECKATFRSKGPLRYPGDDNRVRESIDFDCGSFYVDMGEPIGWQFNQTHECLIRVLEAALAAANERADKAEQDNARLREGIAWLECDIRTADLAQLPENCDEWEAFAAALLTHPAEASDGK